MSEERFLKTVNAVLLTLGFLFLALNLFINALEKAEMSECLQWQKEARVIQDYWITGWQGDQCQRYGIVINAPVKANRK